jgi:hypothetical protein
MLKQLTANFAKTQKALQCTLTFSIENANLMLSPSWASTKLINLVLNNTHFAYADFGLITFHRQADGYIPSLEWWSYIFTRVEKNNARTINICDACRGSSNGLSRAATSRRT